MEFMGFFSYFLRIVKHFNANEKEIEQEWPRIWGLERREFFNADGRGFPRMITDAPRRLLTRDC